MSDVLRYISAVSTASSVATAPRRELAAQTPKAESCPACNYGDNYYGDQICLGRGNR